MNTARLTALPLIIMISALTLGACKQGAPETTKTADAAAPETKPGISAANARIVLPAVPGNPGAAYFTLDNQSSEAVSIASITVDGAGKSEIHTASNGAINRATGGTSSGRMTPVTRADAAPRTRLEFEPGKLHVMLFDLGTLKPGTETELTMTFSDGDKLSVPAKVETMAASAMGGMQH